MYENGIIKLKYYDLPEASPDYSSSYSVYVHT